MPELRCVGIDVSADEITVAIEGRSELVTLPNDLKGHARLVRLVQGRSRRARVCLEATGIYHLDLALALHRASAIEVMVVNPLAARDFARALLLRSKTDRVDARVLLEFALRMPFEPWHPPPQEILDLRAIVRRIGALTLTRTQERNRLHAAGRSAELTEATAWDIEAHLEHLAQSMARLQQQALDLVHAHPELDRRFERLVSVRGEAHERSLNIDFLLGYLWQLLPRRPDLEINITSATIDPKSFSRHFNNAPVIEVSGRSYPVEVYYQPLHGDDEAQQIDLPQAVSEAVNELMQFDDGMYWFF